MPLFINEHLFLDPMLLETALLLVEALFNIVSINVLSNVILKSSRLSLTPIDRESRCLCSLLGEQTLVVQV